MAEGDRPKARWLWAFLTVAAGLWVVAGVLGSAARIGLGIRPGLTRTSYLVDTLGDRLLTAALAALIIYLFVDLSTRRRRAKASTAEPARSDTKTEAGAAKAPLPSWRRPVLWILAAAAAVWLASTVTGEFLYPYRGGGSVSLAEVRRHLVIQSVELVAFRVGVVAFGLLLLGGLGLLRREPRRPENVANDSSEPPARSGSLDKG
jgi:hypothetical protein